MSSVSTLRPLFAVVAFASLLLTPSRALTIDSPDRVASLDIALAYGAGTGNHTAGALETYFGIGPWAKRGELTNNGTNGGLSVNLTSGSWGQSNVAGTWAIDSSFWSLYGNAVIAFHVGNGGGNPDHFAFLLKNGETSGTWSYRDKDGRGGGLSNIFLFSNGTPRVPDHGATVALLGLSLVGLAALRRLFR